MAEYLRLESELPNDDLIPAVTDSIDQTNYQPPQKMQDIAQTRPGNKNQNPDKFSELTPLVFYRILSFLGVNDLARLCLVSARCRERCLSSPDILFDVNFDEDSCTTKCRGLRNLLDKLLDVQADMSGTLLQMNMNLFRLHWDCHECKDFSPTSVFHRWVKWAVGCNAQEIDIGFFPDEVSFALPNCLGSASTTILRLNLQGGQLNCQPKDDFVSIQILSLSSILVPSGCHLGEWISSHFASLKTLKLEKIRLREDLSITSSSLECLTISLCSLGPGLAVCTCNIECTTLKSLLVHYCWFRTVKLYITCPSLQDLQIIKCSNVSAIYSEISTEALCALSIDMIFFGGWATLFEIHTRSLRSLERVSLKLVHRDGDNSDNQLRIRADIKYSVLEFLPRLNYVHTLEIDIGTIGILDLKEVKVVFHNLRHLEITIDDLQKLHATNMATFISVICSAAASLRTVTITYDKCQSNLILLNVVRSLKSCAGKEIPEATEITWLKRPITIPGDGH